MEHFTKNQAQFKDMFTVTSLEEMSRQNMAMFENAMRTAWAPFTNAMGTTKKPGGKDEE
jgi:polyhydroxyalkanoate synthesis regulator protein